MLTGELKNKINALWETSTNTVVWLDIMKGIKSIYVNLKGMII